MIPRPLGSCARYEQQAKIAQLKLTARANLRGRFAVVAAVGRLPTFLPPVDQNVRKLNILGVVFKIMVSF